MTKNLDYYMSLPYSKTLTFYNDESGQYYVSEVVELKGCSSTGNTQDEALECLQEAMECYLETALAYNDPIPEPAQLEDNGNFLKLPQSLYKTLLQKANAEGISLNQYAIQKLSQ
ncbi:MAG: type II toxin-antitoxin system HicB family antitoxin [Turicibacter sp.]|nr:type II toxin-antitoxin system HicB family antitoxin [Turicibacter sp.]